MCNIVGSELQVTWTSPGPCVEFAVSWSGDVLWQDNETSLTGSDTTQNSAYTITDCVPYTAYTVTVDADSGAATSSCTAETPQSGKSNTLFKDIINVIKDD